MTQAILRSALIQGGILGAVGLGVVGFLRSRSELLVAGSVMLFLESVPFAFDGLFVFTIIGAISLRWSARSLARAKSVIAPLTSLIQGQGQSLLLLSSRTTLKGGWVVGGLAAWADLDNSARIWSNS